MAFMITAGLLMAGGLIWLFAFQEIELPPYETVAAGYTEIQATVSANGTVKPVQDVVLTFRSEGYVEECYVRIGDPVQADEVLAIENPDDFADQLSASASNLNSAEATYNQILSTQQPIIDQQAAEMRELQAALSGAEQTLQRQTLLFQAGGVSQSALDQAKCDYDAALARYEAAAARLEQLQASQPGELDAAAAQVDYARSQVDINERSLKATRIVAPFDGYVALIQGNVGQWTSGGAPPVGTAPSSQFSIRVASRELLLSVQINQVDIGKVVVGQEVEFKVDAFPGQVFKGRLSSLAPMAAENGNSETYEAIVTGFDPGLLKGGMPAAATIRTERSGHALSVPQVALSYARSYILKNPDTAGESDSTGKTGKKKVDHKQYLVIMENGQPVVREIETGLSDENSVEITSGLDPGDLVIIDGGLAQDESTSLFGNL